MAGWPSNFVAGKFDATYDTSPIGQTQGGIRIQTTQSAAPVIGDDYGDSVQDLVHRGGNIFVGMVLAEANTNTVAGLIKLLWPWMAANAQFEVGIIGIMGQAQAKSLILTPLAGTPLVTDYTTITFGKSILAPGFPVEVNYQPDLATIPVRLQVLPSAANVWGVIVQP